MDSSRESQTDQRDPSIEHLSQNKDVRARRIGLLERHIQRLERRVAYCRRLGERLSVWRLFSFLGGTAVSAVTLWQWGLWLWAGVTLVVVMLFVFFVRQHQQVDKALTRYLIWQQVKQTHLARMKLDWTAVPDTLPAPPDLDHPFARDLDIVGPRSLHRLLDTAVSHGGSLRLRQWLLETTPDPNQIKTRQALVQEIAPLTSFRDRLILQAAMASDAPETAVHAHDKWPGQRLLEWLNQPQETPSLKRSLLILSLLSGCTLALLLADLLWQIGPWWLISWLPYAFFATWQTRQIGHLFVDAAFCTDALRKLQAIFSVLEAFNYARHPHLRVLCKPFQDRQKRPSAQLRRVSRIVAGAGIKYNPALWLLLNALTPWDIYFAHRLAQARQDLKDLLPYWLETWYQLEAINSLAHFTYLNPEATFPILHEVDHPPLFRAEAIGHPLISATQRVDNNATFNQPGQIYLITGSNMAGKSTFLRTLGINLCLAYAGGPVIAQHLHTSFFRLYTSIQVTDSLSDGFSSFYAEVRRLQALLGALRQDNVFPLFFLIDEIFRGTNNRERLLGSREYVRALAGSSGMGAIATHDLELAKLAEERPGIQNFHFRDNVENGRMTFDYKLQPGPCPSTNALIIMELAGLPVPDGPPVSA